MHIIIVIIILGLIYMVGLGATTGYMEAKYPKVRDEFFVASCLFWPTTVIGLVGKFILDKSCDLGEWIGDR